MTEPVTPGTALVAMPADPVRLNAVRDQLDTRIYPCGFSGWLDLNLDTALLAV